VSPRGRIPAPLLWGAAFFALHPAEALVWGAFSRAPYHYNSLELALGLMFIIAALQARGWNWGVIPASIAFGFLHALLALGAGAVLGFDQPITTRAVFMESMLLSTIAGAGVAVLAWRRQRAARRQLHPPAPEQSV
jgi:ABC-type nickel/cobalt efflux system permease component RcnA